MNTQCGDAGIRTRLDSFTKHEHRIAAVFLFRPRGIRTHPRIKTLLALTGLQGSLIIRVYTTYDKKNVQEARQDSNLRS